MMKRMIKLAIFDLDGTLFDTKNVNFSAYKEAIKQSGLQAEIDYDFYCSFCNGNNYKVFLPKIIAGITGEQMKEIHDRKKQLYPEFLNLARINEHLFSIIKSIHGEYCVALVTTASRKNVDDILQCFNVRCYFDLLITQEDVRETKPSPECFLRAMDMAEVTAENTIIFEDSKEGLEAAQRSGAQYVKVYGFN